MARWQAASRRSSPYFCPKRSTPWAWRRRNKALTASSSPTRVSQASPTMAAWARHQLRVAHEEPDPLFGQVGPVGASPPGLEGMGLDQLPVEKNCTTLVGGPGVEAAADQPIRQRVQGARPPWHEHRGPLWGGSIWQARRAPWQRQENAGLFGLEDLEGSAPLQDPGRSPPCHLQLPPPSVGHHRRHGGEVSPGEEAAPDVQLDRFDPGLGVTRRLHPIGRLHNNGFG